VRRRLEASADAWIRSSVLPQSNFAGRDEPAPDPEPKADAVTPGTPADPAVGETLDPVALAGVTAP
jgi:hypothetical protein